MKLKSSVLFSVAAIVILSVGCRTSRMGSSGPVGRYVESYYKGPGQMLYFVQPIKFSGKKTYLKADFTVNMGDEKITNTTANISFVADSLLKQADSVVFIAADIHYASKQCTELFKERKGKHYVSRQSVEMPTETFKKLLNTDRLTITYYKNGAALLYGPSKKWNKRNSKIHDIIFFGQ